MGDHNLECDVLVPAGQALVIGAAATVGTLTVAVPLAIWASWRWWVPPGAALALGGLAFTLAAVQLVLDHHRQWQGLVVQAVHYELTGDDVEPPVRVDRRLIYVRDPSRQRRAERAGDFRHWLKQVYNGRGTTWRAWKGQRLPSGREVTRPVWEDYTERLQRAGLATRPYDTAPLELSGTLRDAMAAFRELL